MASAICDLAPFIRDGRPGPDREMCIVDPDGHGHMVAELS